MTFNSLDNLVQPVSLWVQSDRKRLVASELSPEYDAKTELEERPIWV
jgi:hypothetical protein